MTKMTKRNVFDALINFANGGELAYETADGMMDIDMDALRTFAEHEIELLEKKALKAKDTAAKKRAEGDELANAVAAALTDEFQSIAEITAQVEGEDVTVSKVSYRLNALAKNGRAEKGEVVVTSESGKSKKVVGYKAM